MVGADGSGLVDAATWTAGDDLGPLNIGAPSSNGPSWSPDSTKFAIAAIGGIAINAADGSGSAIIALADDGEAFGVAYSPDGAHLGFGLVSEFGALPAGPTLQTAEYGGIYVMARRTAKNTRSSSARR